MIGVLQDIGVVLAMQARNDDVAALDVADAGVGGLPARLVVHLLDPRAGRIDEPARARFRAGARSIDEGQAPQAVFATRAREPGARPDLRAELPRADRVQDDQPRIVAPGARIDQA